MRVDPMAKPTFIPPPKPAPDSKPGMAHALLYQAYVENKVHLGMKGALNTRRSPVHNLWENLIPYGLILLVIVNYTYTAGWEGFVLTASLGLGVGAFVIPRWVMNKVRRRTMIVAFSSAEGWESLWRIGGLSMRLDEDPSVVCDSPDGDWQAFAFAHFGERAQTA
jgi:hypothetical protein